MSEHPADPPTPIPHYLAPIRVALGESDLRIVATLRELAAVCAVLHELGLDTANVMLTQRDGSPWLEIDAVAAPEQALTLGETARFALDHGGVVSLALWRYTLAVYRIDEHGAVEDDPVWRPPPPGTTEGSRTDNAGGPGTNPPTGPDPPTSGVPS